MKTASLGGHWLSGRGSATGSAQPISDVYRGLGDESKFSAVARKTFIYILYISLVVLILIKQKISIPYIYYTTFYINIRKQMSIFKNAIFNFISVRLMGVMLPISRFFG